MKFGVQLHPERGIDAVFDEARSADEQGFDSIWLFDHLMDITGRDTREGPLDSFTLMTALGAVTQRTRLAWAMLNLGFRSPALLAKMLATLDVVTQGRVICSVGAGWFEPEYRAYNIPLIEDHDSRVAYGREVIQLIKELWTRPAPERVTFEGQFVQVYDLPFSPAPLQQPHPPIWIGGDSEETLASVKQYGDGWVMLRSGTREIISKVTAAADWPKRELTLVKNSRLFVNTTLDAALDDAHREHELAAAAAPPGRAISREDFLAGAIVGSPDDCVRKLAEVESWGINYLRLNYQAIGGQERVASLLLPRLHEVSEIAAASKAI
jgi:alkanesulfonate monooxygenase SsuD/methylene tetrahydromethanopterin reductase-like flavin-dependent oxidoreductase (luciferase family)